MKIIVGVIIGIKWLPTFASTIEISYSGFCILQNDSQVQQEESAFA